MINSMNLNNLLKPNFNNIKSKRPQPSDEVKAIQEGLSNGTKTLETLTDEEMKSLTLFEEQDKAAWYAEIFEDMSKAEKLAKKVAKGETLTKEEQEFLEEKFPQIKDEAQRAKQEAEALAKRIKAADSKGEKRLILLQGMQGISISNMKSGDFMESIKAQIKMEAMKYAKELSEEDGEIKLEKVDVPVGSFFNKNM
ncbi:MULTISPECIES: hypothetical protein [Clostridium]|uniref:hypothetical protein n=1 Tax=Clostridium TaxID=1485 RepID=UPI000501496A|nr:MULTISPECIES: hypothetical protein [Clostridium]KFX56591.1 alpha-NAC protein [Clostridium botulinum]MBY6777929.1 alpha-NAC protein [Clostridium botulinum]MBY6851083.1 alpha-NAC protein [Clostridium botulinum]MBY7008909.1 alpha-NAC protein [Clostridium botulinum]NFF24863.1 alpha-NAC protein [Clostridium botulinum]